MDLTPNSGVVIRNRPRYDDPTVASGRQLINAGGVGSDNTSIWFVTWGPRATTLLYPKGSAAGLSHKDMGAQLWDAPDGSGKFRALVDHLKWDIGLSVGDWRGNARICNIDVSALTKDAATGADLLDLMIDAEEMIDTASRVGIDSKGSPGEIQTVMGDEPNPTDLVPSPSMDGMTDEELSAHYATVMGEKPHHAAKRDTLIAKITEKLNAD